jgi:multiple sugar transport system permease protein
MNKARKHTSSWAAYIMIAPYVLHLLLFVFFPVIFSIVLTFHKWNIISPMEYIGFENYRHLAGDRMFWKAVLNTLFFLLIHIPLQVLIALSLAYFLNTNIRMRGFFRAAFFMPVVISGVVVTIMWQQLYGLESGVLNTLLHKMRFDRVEWLSNPNVAMLSIALMATWKNVGLYVILFLVGLQTVPISHYEAAEVEGASPWQQFRYITLPAINPTVFLVFILSTIGGFSLFIEPYIMTDGGPLNATLSAMLYIYRQAFGFYHMGYATTLGLFFAILILIVIAIQKKYIETND